MSGLGLGVALLAALGIIGCATGGGTPDSGSTGGRDTGHEPAMDSGPEPDIDAGPEIDSGPPPSEDAGPLPVDAGPPPLPDAGPCAGPEVCNGVDDDCDGVVDDTGCPDRCSGVVYMGRDYVFCNRNQDWTPAQAECAALGMRLVRVDDAGEQTFLRTTANGRGIGAIWIGAGDAMIEARWTWTDGAQFWMGGSGGTAVGGLYSSWSGGEPNDDGTEDCASMTGAGPWNDVECGDGRPFVCERY